MSDKKADLAGPGISTYDEVEKILPADYVPLLPPLKRMKALYMVKNYIEENLAKELNLQMVQVPLIVSKDSGVNDYLDRDGSRTPIDFPCGLGLEKRIEAQVVQAATKWKRMALKQFGCKVGEGINTDMRAVRKDYFLDHDHSSYVDQWDWERVVTADQRNLDFLKDIVKKIWKVIYGAGQMAKENFPELRNSKYPDIPEELKFLHAEEILEMYPDLPRKQRETKVIQEYHNAIFIIGIGWVLKDGYPHEMRAADYDDWVTPTVKKNGIEMHPGNFRKHISARYYPFSHHVSSRIVDKHMNISPNGLQGHEHVNSFGMSPLNGGVKLLVHMAQSCAYYDDSFVPGIYKHVNSIGFYPGIII
jgi:aspartate--ammonia ligase